MEYPLVSITCLPYNSQKTILLAVRSAWELAYKGPIEILIREQGEDDDEYRALEKLTEELGENKDRRILLSRGENLGFAGGHNVLFRQAQGVYVLALNADAMLLPDYLRYAIPIFKDPRVGAVQGKLLRWDLERLDSPVMIGDPSTSSGQGPKTPIIDTTGLLPLKNRRILNRGQGQRDTGQFDELGEVWGADGAVPLYRATALDDVAMPRSASMNPSGFDPTGTSGSDPMDAEYFDEDFFAYKEDVDLAWRLRWRGWKAVYVPEAVAWHGRGSGESASRSYRDIIAERRKIGSLSKYYSFTNQRFVLIKNEACGKYFKDLPFWLIKEIGAWGYALLFERKTISAIGRILKLYPLMWRKRRWIMSHRTPNADPYSFFE